MTFDALLKLWRCRPQPPDALLIKGKGCSWALFEEWRGRYVAPLVFTLNNEDPVSLRTDLHFDIHFPRHHSVPNGITTMVHWALNVAKPDLVQFPIGVMPRRLFGSTNAYMAGIAWLLLNTWPKIHIGMPGCNYNSTPAERGKEKLSTNYWIGRIEQRREKPVLMEARSLLIDRDSFLYQAGREEEAAGRLLYDIPDEDYR